MPKTKVEVYDKDQLIYPFIESDHVTFSNGMKVSEMLDQSISMPTVAHEDLSFKAGVGDQDVSSAIVDSSVAEMTIKGKTYQNILPEPSTHVLTNNKEMFKVNEGLDPNAEIVDGVSKSAILKGNTLVNLLTKTNISVSANTSVSENLKIAYTLPPKKYIMFYNVVVPNTSPNASNNRHTPRVNLEDGSSLYQGYDGFNTSTGRKYWIFTASSNIVDVYYWVQNISTDVVVNNCMLLEYQEGMENWDIPFFRGMQSVKIPVLTTTGSNMVNPTDIEVIGCNSYDVDSDGIINVVGDTTGYWARSYIRYAHHLKGNTTYYIYCDGDSTGTIHAEEWVDNINKGGISWSNFYKYTPEADVLYEVRIFLSADASPFTCSKIRIGIFESTTKPSSFEPYKSNILTVNEEVELRGIGEVQDTLDCLTGELTERIDEYIIDGSEEWYTYNGYNVEGYKSFITTITGLNNLYTGKNTFISGDIKTGSWGSYVAKTAEEMVWNHDPNKIGIKVKNETASNVEELKAYLASNPITFQYELATPVVKTVDLSSSGNWEKVVLDGSEDEVWHNGDSSWANKIFRLDGARHTPNIMNSTNALVETGLLFSSHFEEKGMNHLCNVKPQPEGVSIYGDSIFVGSPQISTIGELRTWLSQNPITVWYQTKTSLDSTQVKQPIFFKDGHIQLSNGADNSLIPTLDYQAKTSNSYVMDLMKTNTKYTMKAKTASGTFTIDGTSYGAGTNGTFTTPTSMANKFLVMSNKTNKEVMILEGDVTDKTIPYFKGIKSTFEGEDKIEVLSAGKNLFDGAFEKGMIDVNGVLGYVPTAIRTVNYINVKPNTSYHINLLNLEPFESFRVIYVHEYDENFKVLGETEVGNRNTYTSKSATKFIKINTHTAHDLPVDSKMIVCENSTLDKQYEPYKSNSTKIPLLSPLRSLPNGVCDEIILDRENNKAKIIQRVGICKFDSKDKYNCSLYTTGDWVTNNSTGLIYRGYTPKGIDLVENESGYHICNSLTTSTRRGISSKTDVCILGDGQYMGLKISNDKIGYNGRLANDYLSKNPVVVYYQLATPVITEVDLEGYPYIYKDGHIFLNSEIVPTTEIIYSVNQCQQISASNEDIIRHEKELTYLQKLIAQYIQVDYESVLLSLKV